MTPQRIMIFLVWITAIGLLVSIFFYNLANLVLGRASKIRFWDLEKLRLELRKFKHKLIDVCTYIFLKFVSGQIWHIYIFFHAYICKKITIEIFETKIELIRQSLVLEILHCFGIQYPGKIQNYTRTNYSNSERSGQLW